MLRLATIFNYFPLNELPVQYICAFLKMQKYNVYVFFMAIAFVTFRTLQIFFHDNYPTISDYRLEFTFILSVMLVISLNSIEIMKIEHFIKKTFIFCFYIILAQWLLFNTINGSANYISQFVNVSPSMYFGLFYRAYGFYAEPGLMAVTFEILYSYLVFQNISDRKINLFYALSMFMIFSPSMILIFILVNIKIKKTMNLQSFLFLLVIPVLSISLAVLVMDKVNTFSGLDRIITGKFAIDYILTESSFLIGSLEQDYRNYMINQNPLADVFEDNVRVEIARSFLLNILATRGPIYSLFFFSILIFLIKKYATSKYFAFLYIFMKALLISNYWHIAFIFLFLKPKVKT